MKAWLRSGAELLLVILLVPQAFVLCYFFTYFFIGGNQAGLLRSLALYALTISWVSAPFLAALLILVRALIRTRVRWYVTLLCCAGSGYLWPIAWNLLVYEVFAYGRAALPVALCCLGTAGYALARDLYLKDLPPPEKTKSSAPDLPE